MPLEPLRMHQDILTMIYITWQKYTFVVKRPKKKENKKAKKVDFVHFSTFFQHFQSIIVIFYGFWPLAFPVLSTTA